MVEVFQQYCTEPLQPAAQVSTQPWVNYGSGGSMRRKQRKQP